MINGKIVKAVIFAGRKKFLEILIPQLLCHKELDNILIFKNTDNKDDVEYINSISGNNVTVIDVPQNKQKYSKFYWIYTQLTEDNTIYFKIDDDIVYLDKDVFHIICQKMENSDYLLYYPFIINNPFCNCLLDNREHINGDFMVDTWRSGGYASLLHRCFIEGNIVINNNDIIINSDYNIHSNGVVIRPSINFIAFSGKNIKKLVKENNSVFKQDDEQFLTKDALQILNKSSLMTTGVTVVHYSFFTQYHTMEHNQHWILNSYKKMANKEYSKNLFNMDNKLINIFVFTFFMGDNDLPLDYTDTNVFKSIQCGANINKHIRTIYKDNEGINISDYNKYLNEATGIYWVGKHLDDICKTEYIGFMTYRRFLDFDNKELCKNKIICSNIQLENHSNMTVLQYAYKCEGVQYKSQKDIIMSLPIDKKQKVDILRYMTTETNMPNCNMFIMSVELFRKYFEFIYPIIEWFTKEIDVAVTDEKFKSLSIYEQRIYALTIERLTAYWIFRQQNNGIELCQRLIRRFPIENKINGGELKDIGK